MIRVMFVCHGNICRSPMAEFVLRDRVGKLGLGSQFRIASSATSTEEIGNPVHPGTRRILAVHGISAETRAAVRLKKEDYRNYDYIIGMDSWNLSNILRIVGEDTKGKVSLLLDYTDRPGPIADPWYTGDFEATYRDVSEGCDGFLKTVQGGTARSHSD